MFFIGGVLIYTFTHFMKVLLENGLSGVLLNLLIIDHADGSEDNEVRETVA